jgi:hypothetical protein
MDDNPIIFAHAVFHVIIFIMAHSLRAGRGTKINRKQRGMQNRSSVMPPRLRIRAIKTAERN